MAVSAQALWSDAISRAGTDEELALLVREHARLVYRVAYSVLRSPEDAEDAVQEVFLRVLRQRKRLSDVHDARAWLARIAFRVALDKRAGRRSGREVALEESVESGIAAAPGAADPAQQAELLHRLLASLPVELRQPLELSTLEELSAAEIGVVLEIPEGTVRNRIHRARRQLRQKLAALMEKRHAGR